MFELFKQDALRWIRPSEIADPAELTPRVLFVLLYRYLPLRAMAWFRLGGWFNRRHIPIVPGFIQRRLYRRYGLEIPIGSEIGGGLYIAHPVGCVLAPTRMGKNCSVIAAVTIGMRNERKWPIIGDNVFIGAGARILGDICVADNAAIGANAVVLHDVPAGATVVGIPARLVGERLQVR